jgi:hypothetical protein
MVVGSSPTCGHPIYHHNNFQTNVNAFDDKCYRSDGITKRNSLVSGGFSPFPLLAMSCSSFSYLFPFAPVFAWMNDSMEVKTGESRFNC